MGASGAGFMEGARKQQNTGWGGAGSRIRSKGDTCACEREVCVFVGGWSVQGREWGLGGGWVDGFISLPK